MSGTESARRRVVRPAGPVPLRRRSFFDAIVKTVKERKVIYFGYVDVD
jgi:hypothetical protein